MLNKKRVLSVTLASVAGLLVASSASASGAYFGGQLGYGMTHQPGFTNTDVSRLTAYSRSNTPNGLAGRVFGGYDVTTNFSAEMGFTKFSNATAKLTATAPASGTLKETVKTYAVDLVGKATMPLQDGFNIYGKAGVAYLHGAGNVTLSTVGTTLNGRTSVDRKFLPTFGAGVGYEINKNVSADASWTHIQKVGSTNFLKNTDFFGLGLGYHFG